MNKLGDTELQNTDPLSWASKNPNGDVQVLFWDFTNTHPGDKELNQTYYLKDLPSKSKGKVKIEITGLQEGEYHLEIYKVGYKKNDVYADYLAMGKPSQLTKEQVETLKKLNNGSPTATQKVAIGPSGNYSKDFDINENDVFLLNLIKQ
jgi:xylan 1,4-beta-xylosidase